MTSSSKQRVACIIDLGFRKWIIPFCSRSGYTEAKDLHLFHNHQDSSVVFKLEGEKEKCRRVFLFMFFNLLTRSYKSPPSKQSHQFSNKLLRLVSCWLKAGPKLPRSKQRQRRLSHLASTAWSRRLKRKILRSPSRHLTGQTRDYTARQPIFPPSPMFIVYTLQKIASR